MKKSKFSESQIVLILKEAESQTSAGEMYVDETEPVLTGYAAIGRQDT